MKFAKIFTTLAFIAMLFCGCQSKKEPPENGIYYWRTTFSLNDYEHSFLQKHNIKRLYLRLFDVGLDMQNPNVASPIATLRFKDSIPQNMEIIPVVFIDNEVFKKIDMTPYVSRICDRIIKICKQNGVTNIRYIQMDCDWIKTTRDQYFTFLQRAKGLLHDKGLKLYATIRLHQLSETPPDVDKGLLMCYNTGALLNEKTNNSILAASDVNLYAKHLSKYKLELDVAYPAFSWSVVFREGKFVCLLRGFDTQNQNIKLEKSNIYSVMQSFVTQGQELKAGDKIRVEIPEYQQIEKSKKIIEKRIKGCSIAIFALDSANLVKFNENEIKEIFNN
ncbi:MAG: hypothetical protein LBO06_02820 [Bacteroidales bacterium]|jgi:hypothetical protein|nr:hypothetical protein [Bacteroidales bacterium]